MKRVAVVLFPGTNSEDETVRALRAVGLDAESVHWSRADTLPQYAAYVLPGGFAYEDRVRAGAVAAHDASMDHVLRAAQAGKIVVGICNGAQVLAEAGLVPGTGPVRRPTAAFAPNASGRFESIHVHVRLAVPPSRVPLLAGIAENETIPMWAAHGDGRLVAPDDELRTIIAGDHVAFVYADRDGRSVPAPNGSALDCAALVNREGNVLGIMPHPERDAWAFMHARGPKSLAPSGGIAFFRHLAAGINREVARV